MVEWQDDVLPVLEAVWRTTKSKVGYDPTVSQREINDRLGREPDDRRTDRALYELARTGYVTSTFQTDVSLGPLEVELTEKGLQTVGGWPGRDPADAFLAALQARVDAEESVEERSAAQRLLDAAKGLSREVLSEIVANAAMGRFG